YPPLEGEGRRRSRRGGVSFRAFAFTPTRLAEFIIGPAVGRTRWLGDLPPPRGGRERAAPFPPNHSPRPCSRPRASASLRRQPARRRAWSGRSLRPAARRARRRRRGIPDCDAVPCAPPRDRRASAGRAPAPTPAAWFLDRATAAAVS